MWYVVHCATMVPWYRVGVCVCVRILIPLLIPAHANTIGSSLSRPVPVAAAFAYDKRPRPMLGAVGATPLAGAVFAGTAAAAGTAPLAGTALAGTGAAAAGTIALAGTALAGADSRCAGATPPTGTPFAGTGTAFAAALAGQNELPYEQKNSSPFLMPRSARNTAVLFTWLAEKRALFRCPEPLASFTMRPSAEFVRAASIATV